MQYRISNRIKKGKFRIELPASKSINNRLLILSALSNSAIKLKRLSESDDSQIMQKLLSSEGIVKDAGHAGTVMRFLTAYYACQSGEYLLTGTQRMKNRPIAELVDALKNLGADISYQEKKGYPPVLIKGKNLIGGKTSINSGISSQYISALMMIGAIMPEGLELELKGEITSSSYIDLTQGLMKKTGIDLSRQDNIIKINPSTFKEMELDVEADWSSASYWFSIVGLSEDLEILLPGLEENSLQGDRQITRLYKKIGVMSEFTPEGLSLKSISPIESFFENDFKDNPDMVQSFIPYCIARNIPFHFNGCKSLRIKETDRVEALSIEMKKFGAILNYSEDGDIISWDGKTPAVWDKKIIIDTYDDHRMALGIAPLCIKSGELIINNPSVVSKSYPGYWKDLNRIGLISKKI